MNSHLLSKQKSENLICCITIVKKVISVQQETHCVRESKEFIRQTSLWEPFKTEGIFFFFIFY